MAKLYLANLARQTHEFRYRIPADEGYSDRVQIQTIAPGTQQQIYRDAPLAVLEAIVDQHRVFGIVEASEVHKTQGFVGLCFSFDKPVNLDQLNYGADHNRGAMFDIGQQNLKDAAIAADVAFENTLIDAQRHGEIRGSTTVKAIHVETLEDSDSPKFGEGIKVDHLTPVEGGRRRA